MKKMNEKKIKALRRERRDSNVKICTAFHNNGARGIFYLCVYMHALVWRSEDNLAELVLSFHHAGSRGGTQAVSWVASEYPLSHLAGPQVHFTAYSLTYRILK